ncbi:MAG: lipopolysaccharide biosynthesis protein [Lachnospiraceae bacterium]|nr:lipopolysaccharide biosynthesis protein [Lachnospiraceae bacterium]MBR6152207.1 lipopolysaccharide biosynthesis protein [Lachnospiraceae bacterium]
MKEISKEQFAKGTIWKLLERFTGRGISLVISVILARLLSPDDYGLIALTTVFTNLSEILIDAGFGTTLIRKKEVGDEDYACVFAISASVSTVLYIIFFSISPFVATYYNKPELTSVLRVMSLVLFIQAFGSTRNAFVNRNMQFKLLMKCNTVAAIISGMTGIACAYYGMGVWALVIQRLLHQTIITLILFVKLKWRPKFHFDKNKFNELFGFSAGVIGATLVNYMENCVNSLVIGKHYSVADLGYMDKAYILPEQISLNTIGAMTNVLLPTVSSYQDNIPKLKQVIRKVVRYTGYILFPIMLGMLVISKEAVVVLFSEKWLSAVPMMRFICIYYIATPLMLIDVQVFFGLGHSNTRLKTEIYRMVFILTGVMLCCFVFDWEIKYFSMMNAIAVSLGTLITHIEVKKLIGYSMMERIQDTYKALISSLFMCVVVLIVQHCINPIVIPEIIKLIAEVLSGGVTYLILSMVLKIDVFSELLDIVSRRKEVS